MNSNNKNTFDVGTNNNSVDKEYNRGYNDAMKEFNSPYAQGYRKAIEDFVRSEMIRKSVEDKTYFL